MAMCRWAFLTEQFICVTCYEMGKTANETYDSLKVVFSDESLS
jgi:hypothetical protein